MPGARVAVETGPHVKARKHEQTFLIYCGVPGDHRMHRLGDFQVLGSQTPSVQLEPVSGLAAEPVPRMRPLMWQMSGRHQ